MRLPFIREFWVFEEVLLWFFRFILYRRKYWLSGLEVRFYFVLNEVLFNLFKFKI